MSLYLLEHVHELPTGDDVKTIGIYSSRKKAEEAIKRLAGQPGFKDNSESFNIDKYEVDEDHWTEGFITLA